MTAAEHAAQVARFRRQAADEKYAQARLVRTGGYLLAGAAALTLLTVTGMLWRQSRNAEVL